MATKTVEEAMSGMGKRIRERRTVLKMTQRDVARAIDASEVSITRIEGGQGIALATFYKLCQALQCSADDILGLKG